MKCPSCGNRNREGARFCDFCGAALEAPEPAGEATRAPERAEADLPSALDGGRYRVQRSLGRGGRKRVFLAHDTDEDREVALAMFEVEGVEETILARARREAQAMERLGAHPHIVRVYDSGEEDGRPFIVSEYMPGGDVEGMLDSSDGRRLDAERAVSVGVDVCRALEHAHGRGIVHRDLKPANVWLAEDGTARLGDFGLAATDRRSRDAVEGMLVGTVAYLPPEQALGRASDARSDLYSLGALLYEMLTGQPPFPGDDAVAIISQHLNADPVAPSVHNPALPKQVDEAILRLLAKSPDGRPASAVEARRELEALTAAFAAAGDGAEAETQAQEENPLDRLAGGVFVGRERELDEMRASLEDALGGRGGLLLLVGEPGIGKTRSAEELATYARVRGAKVHWGRCHEGEGAPAYWPWREALRSYVRDADPVGLAWELGPVASDVAEIVPEVREALGEVEPPQELDSEEARFRIFDSVATFLTGAARSRPIVLVLDDLHWADEPSLLLLKFIARQLGDSGLLIVATYRDIELGRHHPLAGTLAELAEIEQTRRIALRGLDTEAVARYIEMTAGIEPPPGLAEAVHEQTEGNPFFVTEVVRLLASEGRLEPGAAGWELAIPEGVRDVVGRRLNRLSEGANEVLTLAAAVGREFEVEILERLNGRSPEGLDSALDEAADAQLIGERSGSGRFAFSHALVRETLYSEIRGPRRVHLHREIGEALEDLHGADPEPPVAELARHFIEAAPAGDAEKAVDYAVRAAREASAKLAYEEAAAQYERALEALELCEGADSPGERRLELLLALGESQRRAGRFIPARETFDDAAALARKTDDSDALARAALEICQLSETGSVDEPLVELLREALEAVGPQDSATRAELLSGLSSESYWRDPQGEALPMSREAIEIARRIGDDRALALALGRLTFLLVTAELQEERVAANEEMLATAQRAGDREAEVRARMYVLRDKLEQGDIAAVDRGLEAYAKLANELRQPQHLWHIPLVRGVRATMEGRFDEAERLADEALAGGRRAQEPLAEQFYALQMSILRRHQGRIEEIAPGIREMAARYPAVAAWRLSLTSFLAELGRVEEARPEFERLAAHDFEDVPLDGQWLPAIVRLAESCSRIGDAKRAAILYEMLLPYEGLVVVGGRAAGVMGTTGLYLGRLATTAARHDDAVRHLERSIELCGRTGDRPFDAESRYHLAEALLARDRSGDRERALELLGECLDSAQDMGMRALVESALALRLEAQGLSAIDVTTSIDTVISAVESERPDIRSHAAPDGTVTILFSDIENSTLMTERLGDERWLEVLRAHNSIFRRRLGSHGGYEVKSQGDGFMLVFSDAREALECAAAIQRDLAEAEMADGEQIRVRMGMHSGEAIAEEGDFFGRSVILAARIAAQALGEEILVSEELKRRCEADTAAVGFDDGRVLELKGLAGTHRVFRAEWEAEPSTA